MGKVTPMLALVSGCGEELSFWILGSSDWGEYA